MIYKFNELDSTNEYLKLENTKYRAYDIILAKNQTRGKARRGNTWISSEGMALFTFYTNNTKNALNIPILAGYACIKALNKIIEYNFQFKWTNDVYLDNKKLLGILVEYIGDKIYIGIGINVNNNIDLSLRNNAISLKEKFNKEFNIDNIVNLIVEEFKILETLPFVSVIGEINKINYLKNKEILFKVGNETLSGICLDIEENGALQIEVDGKVNKYMVGEITRVK